MLLSRSKAQNEMPEFDNPSFLRLGAGAALAFGSLLQEVLQLQFEAPELFLGVPEMVPAMELAGDLAREPEMALEFEPVMELEKALEIAQSNRWVLSSPPWVSFPVADPLTW